MTPRRKENVRPRAGASPDDESSSARPGATRQSVHLQEPDRLYSLRAADWRWKLAEELARFSPPERRGVDAVATLAAERIAGGITAEPGRPLRQPMRAIDEAIRANEESALGDELRLLILAGTSPELISRATEIEIATVRRFEQLFFDLRDRLDAGDWLTPNVLEPLVRSRSDDYPLRLRLAMGGGPKAAIAVCDAALPLEAAMRYAERERELARRRSGTLHPTLTEKRAREAYASLAAEYGAESERLRLAVEETRQKARHADATFLAAPRGESGSSMRPGDGSMRDSRDSCSESSSDDMTVKVSPGAAKAGLSEPRARGPARRGTRIDRATEAKRALYGRICGLAVPFRFGPPFDGLQPKADTYAGFEDPAAALQALRVEFGEEELIAAKAAARDAGGMLRLAECLGASSGPFVAILDGNGSVLDLLTENGLLSGELPLSLAISRGEEEQDLDDEFAQLLLPLAVEGVAFFRTLGIPATTPAGLASMTPSQLDRLQRQLSSGHSMDRSEPRNPYLAMVFVDWPPSAPATERSPRLSELTSVLHEFERSGRLDTSGFYVWSPDATEIERWSRAAGRGDVAGLRAAVHRSLGGATPLAPLQSIAPAEFLPPEDPTDLTGALQLHRSAGSGSDEASAAVRARAAEILADRYRVAVGEPLLAAALDAPDPLERSERLQEAQLAEFSFLLGAELRRHAEHGFASASPEEFARKMKVMDGYLEAQKLLMAARTKDGRCRKKRETFEGVARRASAKALPKAGSSPSD